MDSHEQTHPTPPTTSLMKSSRQFLFGGAGGADQLADAGLALLRLFAGLALALAHGINKIPPSEGFVGRIGGFGFPLPEAWAWFSGIAEFGAALLLAIGLFTRPAALLIVMNFTVALVFAHIMAGDPFARMELAMFFWVTAVFFLTAGAGRYSIDGFIRSRQDASTVSRYVR